MPPHHDPSAASELPSAHDLVAALRGLIQAAQRYSAGAGGDAAPREELLRQQARAFYQAQAALGGDAGHFEIALTSRDGQQHHTVLALQRAPGGGR